MIKTRTNGNTYTYLKGCA